MTPDSFSDGGEFVEVDTAIRAGISMHDQGAAFVDVGGESTRPGAQPVSADEEIRRILPVIDGLAQAGVPVSVDTSKPSVARAAVEAGAGVINDVSGFENPQMAHVAAETGVGIVLMHMQGEPRTMQAAPTYGDVVAEVSTYLRERAESVVSSGVAPEAVVVDPGFGFGKTVGHNLELIAGLDRIAALGYPVMIGTSRKSTLAALTGEQDPKQRDGHTAVTTALGYERGARVFRVHDVAGSRDALQIAAAIVDPQTWEKWQQDSNPGDSPG